MVDQTGFFKEYILGPLINLIVEDCYKYVFKLNLLRVILYAVAGFALAIVVLAVDKSFFSESEFHDLYLVGSSILTSILAHICVPNRPEKAIVGLTFTVVYGFLAYAQNNFDTIRLISCLLPLTVQLMTCTKNEENQKRNAEAVECQGTNIIFNFIFYRFREIEMMFSNPKAILLL